MEKTMSDIKLGKFVYNEVCSYHGDDDDDVFLEVLVERKKFTGMKDAVVFVHYESKDVDCKNINKDLVEDIKKFK